MQLTKAFEGHELRAVTYEGRPAVVASDIANALGYSRASDFSTLARDKYRGTAEVSTPGGVQEVTVLTEPGMWQALTRTRKEKAEPLQDWINEEVFPAIRKTGSYEHEGEGVAVQQSEPTVSVDSGAAVVDRAHAVAEEVSRLKEIAGRKRREAEKIEQAIGGVAVSRTDQIQSNGTIRIPDKHDTPKLAEAEEPGEKIGVGELRLKRPLVVLDLETTGLDTDTAMITEIAAYRLVPGEGGVPQEDTTKRLVTYVNPEQEISDHVVDLTGITNGDVADAPTFEELMPHISSMVADADLMGYNAASYDVPLLRSLYKRHDSKMPGPPARVIVDPYRIEQALRGNKLSEVYKRYTGKGLEGAHRAEADTKATYVVLRNQIPALPISGAPTPSKIVDITKGRYLDEGQKLMRDGESVVVTFGEHDGKTLTKVRESCPGYFYNFMLELEDLRPYILNHFDDLDSNS